MANAKNWILLQFLDINYRILRTFAHYMFAVMYWSRRSKVPPVENPILLTSATELARLIREKQLTSEVVIKTFIDRILEVEPFINATVECRFNDALEEAKRADALVASGTMTKEQLEVEKPLLGVPFSVKVLITVKGLLSTSGSILFKDVRADEDATTVDLMKKAGAIVLVTTNSSEVGLNIQTSNNLHGTTCNPYDTSRTSGGSSGGESALLAAAGSVIGLGNDLGGSIRIPCMFSGLFGHKTSRGLVSNYGCFPPVDEKMDCMFSTGPMCRYAEDLVTTMKILSEPKDKAVMFGKKVNFKDIKVYYITSFGHIPLTENVHSDVQNAVIKVASYFELHQGSKVQQITIPLLKMSFFTFVYSLISRIPDTLKILTAGKAKLNGIQELLKFLCLQSKFTLGYVVAINAPHMPLFYKPKLVEFFKNVERKIDDQISSFLDDKSILILPTMPFSAPYHHETTLYVGGICYTCIFNVLGMPSTQCPVGLNRQGLPVGVQIVSQRGNDHLTVACALEIERAFGGWKPPK